MDETRYEFIVQQDDREGLWSIEFVVGGRSQDLTRAYCASDLSYFMAKQLETFTALEY
jgi:hypothetical protein